MNQEVVAVKQIPSKSIKNIHEIMIIDAFVFSRICDLE